MNAKKTKNKSGKVVLAVLLAAIVAVFGLAGFLALKLLDKLHVNPGGEIPYYQHGLDEEPEDPASFETVYDITDAENLNSFLFQWWHNGWPEMIRYSKDVVNVLLIGVDNNDGEPGAGRSDTMMLASVNKRTRTITLLSFLRDSYCFFDVNGEPRYQRLNSAYFYGGPHGLMESISRLYKIRVDKYITVNFRSFPKLINALGGVTVEVTQAEARYLNRNAKSITRTLEPGILHLNGTEALAFSRIRKLDTDMARVNRQQLVIRSILDSAQRANMVQLYNALYVSLDHVETNYARTELLGLLPSAMSWLHFEVVNMTSPVLEGPECNAIGATIKGMDILIVDYPKAAQQVQLALYGVSNVELGDDHDAIIESLFAGAVQKKTSNSTPRPTQEDGPGGGAETPPQSNQPFWPFWLWGGGTDTQPEEPPVQEPVWPEE